MLAVGDIHIKPDNINTIDILEKNIHRIIRDRNISQVVLLGDILHYHERLHTQALNKACDLIDGLRRVVKVWILVGNHDMINNQQFLTELHWMNFLKYWENVYIVDKTYIDENTNFVFVPFVPPGRFIEALDIIGSWKEKTRVLFAHQEFKNCKMGAILSTQGDEWNEEYPLVISGHIHEQQKIGSNIFYIGSSIQTSFGETNIPMLLEINIETLEQTKHYIDELPKKKTIYIDLEDIKKNTFRIPEHIDDLRIVVKGDWEEFKIFQNSVQYKKLDDKKVVFKPIKEDMIKRPYTKIDFEKFLYDKVLESRDEFLYCVYSEIVHNEKIGQDEVLII